MTMTERIEVQNVRKEGQPNAKGQRSVYYVEEVACPKVARTKRRNAANNVSTAGYISERT